jgi:hypothetical protein
LKTTVIRYLTFLFTNGKRKAVEEIAERLDNTSLDAITMYTRSLQHENAVSLSAARPEELSPGWTVTRLAWAFRVVAPGSGPVVVEVGEEEVVGSRRCRRLRRRRRHRRPIRWCRRRGRRIPGPEHILQAK